MSSSQVWTVVAPQVRPRRQRKQLQLRGSGGPSYVAHNVWFCPPTVSSVRIYQAACHLNLVGTLRALAPSVASSFEGLVFRIILPVKETRKRLPPDAFEANDGA